MVTDTHTYLLLKKLWLPCWAIDLAEIQGSKIDDLEVGGVPKSRQLCFISFDIVWLALIWHGSSSPVPLAASGAQQQIRKMPGISWGTMDLQNAKSHEVRSDQAGSAEPNWQDCAGRDLKRIEVDSW